MEPTTAAVEPKGSIKMDLADKLSDRLVEVESGCWEFIGGRTGAGYGAVSLSHTKQIGAHILAYELEKGPIPSGMFVCHSCDNPPCCNPEHLFLGTYQDNKDDEVAKGRYVHGIKHGMAILSEQDVIHIRTLLDDGYTQAEIGRMYNVTRQAIFRIKNKLTWRHM